MNCECIEDIEKRLAEKFRAEAGESAKAMCLDTAFFLGKNPTTGLNVRFRITGDKKGYTSAKGKEMPVKANYCPFCGKRTDPFEPEDKPQPSGD